MEGKVDHRETSMDHQSEGSSEAYPARPNNSYEGFQGGHLILVKIKNHFIFKLLQACEVEREGVGSLEI